VQDVENYIKHFIEKQDRCRSSVILPRDIKYYDLFILPSQHCFNETKGSTSFRMDDLAAYEEFFTRFYDRKTRDGLDLMMSVHVYLNQYFGYDVDEDERDFVNSRSKEYSIRDYMSENCATSFERSYLAHNLLCLAGCDSCVLFVEKEVEGKKTPHALVSIKLKNGYLIMDPVEYLTYTHHNFVYRFPVIEFVKSREVDSFFTGYGEIGATNTTLRRVCKEACLINVPEVYYSLPGKRKSYEI